MYVNWGIFILEKTEDLDICPFCESNIPQGPAYFCPTCGKKLDDEYSKRKIIFDEEVSEISTFEDIPEDLEFDEDDDSYDIDNLINDLESGSVEISASDYKFSDFEDEDEDYTVDDLIQELEYEDREELDFDFVEHQVLGDVDSFSIDEGNRYDAENFVSFLESGNEFELTPISEDDLEFSHKQIPSVENSLELKNKSIKLDLWLKECVDQKYINSFLKYKSIKLDIDESPVSKIISSFELEELIKFKYRSLLNEFTDSLKKLFLPLGTMQIVEIARKHDVKISLSKEGLIKNFLKKFTVYELILIFNEEGLSINDYLNISVLEQIYLASDSKLKEISYKISSKEYDSKHEMISSIVNYYDEEYLISHEIFRGDAL